MTTDAAAPQITYPISTIAIARTVRLVTTARLRDPVLLHLVGASHLDDLTEIEGATNGRLQQQARGSGALAARELVSGLPHAAFINAAFTYWRPREQNRFNGPGRGAWYAALHADTCIAEVSFHLVRELERVNHFSATVDYAEMFASFAGQFADLRHVKPVPVCLNPDIAIGYPAGNAFADTVRADGKNGIVYPSVRHDSGTCLVALWPTAVQSVTQGRVLRLQWNGGRAPQVEVLSA
jgi:RES domain-containing protein